MSKSAIDHFINEVNQVIDRFSFEYNINYAELIGALTLIIHDMSYENKENNDAQ